MSRLVRLRRSFAPVCALSALLFAGCSSSEPAPIEDTGLPPLDAPDDTLPSETGDDALPDAADDVSDSNAPDADDADGADDSTAPDADASDDSSTTNDADAMDADDAGETDAAEASADVDAADDTSDASDGDAELPCTAPSDCPGSDTDCLKRTCVSSKCGVSYVALGTAVASQVTGDCKKNVCDGNGGTTSQEDDLDVPNDGNACTSDVCTNGVPSNPAVTSGSACNQGGGKVCNATGACVACNTASDCSGTDSECQHRTCTSGVCGVANTAIGTAVASQVTGDCKKNVCDGNGAITTQNDDTDLPVDANECTTDTCSNGTPSNASSPSGTTCGGGAKVCDGNGACVQCTNASQCPGVDNECQTRTCTAGACGFSYTTNGTAVASQTAGDCKKNICNGSGAIVTTADDLDLPVDANECTSDLCSGGVPSNPPAASGTACGAGGASKCDGAGQCVGCITASECPGVDNECQTRTCTAGVCGISYTPSGTAVSSQVAGDCKKNVCNGNGATISSIDTLDVPFDANECTDDVCSVAGVPSNPPTSAGSVCHQNGGTQCDGSGACVECQTAGECPGVDTECQVRTCVAGMCGVVAMPAGTLVSAQSVGDCKVNACDGLGGIVANVDDADVPVDGIECTQDVCTNGTPSNPPAAGGTSCSENGGKFCDGAGVCVACMQASDCGTDTACTTYACNAGTCQTNYASVGTPLPTAQQAAGDCQQLECDGAGATISAVDNGDLPVDGKQCTDDVCTMGVPSNPNSALGTVCSENSGTACNGVGVCVAQPTVSATAPVDGSTGTLANTSIAITFSSAISASTLTAQTTAGACSGSIQVSLDDFASCIAFASATPTMNAANTIASLTPAPGLLVNRNYKIRVTSEAKNATGIPAVPYTQPTGFTTVSPTVCGGGAALVMSQIYPGGGGSSGTYKYDYVELHNRAPYAINLSGLSLEYASATGTSWAPNVLNGIVPPGGYFLVQMGSAGTGGGALPTPDAIGSSGLGGTGGKIALVSTISAMPSGTCPNASAIDFVNYGSSSTCASAPMTAPTATQAAIRATNGCTYTGALADFSNGTPAPRNSATTPATCGCTATTLNESNAALEADYCNVQFPLSMSVQTGTATPTVYGRLYESGVTPTGGAGSVKAQLGFGPLTSNPEYQAGWTWANASYNASCSGCGNNDEYQASFTAPAAGSYGYVYRFSLDNGTSWTYCDANQGDLGAGSNPGLSFDFANEPVMTVTP